MRFSEVCNKKYKFNKARQHFLRFLIHLITIVQITLLCNLANASAVSVQDSERIAAETSGKEVDKAPTIELNEGEKAWIKARPRIVLGTDASWVPYVVVGKDAVVRGLDPDYIALLNKKLGTRIELRTGKWVDMVAAAKAHEIDGLANSAPMEERRTHFHFSDSYTTLYKYIVIQEDADFEVRGLQDLAGRTVAVEKGNAFDREMLDEIGSIDIVETPSAQGQFTLIDEAKVDAAIADITLFSLLAPDEIDRLKIAYVIKERPLHLVYSIRKDWPELIGILNKGLAAISEEERQAIRQKWIGLKYEEKIDYALIWKIIAVSVLLLALLFLWSWQTRRQKVALKRAHDELELKVQERTAELVFSEDRLKRTQAIGHIGSWVWNLNKGGEQFWSDESYRILGYSPNKIDPSYELFFNRIHPDDRTLVSNAVEKTLHEKLMYNVDFRIITVDGLERAVNSRADIVCDASGRPVQLLGTLQDITERKQAEEKERQHMLELAHVSRLSTMGEMATEIAHELNQPLTSIASYGDTLSRLKKSNSLETEDMDDALQEITKQAHRAADILQHLRGLVQKDVSMQSSIDINALVQEVIQLTNVEIRSNDIYIHQDMAQSLPEVRCNKILIEQVVMNLIRNAIDAMSSEKCIERQLIIQTQLNEKGKIEVGIGDTGPGLSSEMLEGIFKPFFTTKQDGMGMGLSICRSIIEEHGGKLWASSEPDRGATLKFTIPVSGPVEVKNAN